MGVRKLDAVQQDFVIKSLALERRSDQIIADLKELYEISITKQNVDFYRKKTAEIAAKREEIKENLEDNFAIARAEYRLQQLEELLRKADEIGDLDVEAYVD